MSNVEKILDDFLVETHALFQEYQSLAAELAAHHVDEAYHHHLHELEMRMNHIKLMLHESDLSEEDKRKKFLEHHLLVMQHINQHMAQMDLHLSEILESEKLHALKIDMLKILKEIELKKENLEAKYRERAKPSPFLSR